MNKIVIFLLCCVLLITGCQADNTPVETPAVPSPTVSLPTAIPSPLPLPTPSPTPLPATVWVAPDLPAGFWEQLRIDPALLQSVEVPQDAGLRIEVLSPLAAAQVETKTPWLYVLAAPFDTARDSVTAWELRNIWQGKDTSAQIVTSEETSVLLTHLLGQPSFDGVTILLPDQLLEAAWTGADTWALLPFEALEPRWKVLRVDEGSPLDAGLNLADYPLTAWLGLAGPLAGSLPADALTLPPSNRNLEQMTTLVMTGTTALARHTAEQMELQGITYPAEAIVDWLRDADYTHISNEASFYTNCPPAVPFRTQARFCSAPKNIELLEYVGADIIELTGNHLMDWKTPGFLETLALYRERGLLYYGGGEDLQEAQKPLLLEHNGNRIAFVGCNAVGPDLDFADRTWPGSLKCDRQQLAAEVTRLKAEGYLPIVTFQHYEVYDNAAPSALRTDFRRMADAGAVIISGSQAHVPHGFSFYHGSFLSYGLGNLFFDQMDKLSRPGLIERHVFYQGRHISTEVFTTLLQNSARRVPLAGVERSKLLLKLFDLSDWDLAK